jgi:4-hydroxybenzoate polyprenyltransferase
VNAITAINSVETRWARVGTGAGPLNAVGAYLRLIRPTTRLWLDSLLPFTVLVAACRGWPDPRTAALLIVTMNTVHLAATIFNDIEDVEIDKASTEVVRRHRPIASGAIPVRTARTVAIAALVVGLVCAFLQTMLFGVAVVVLAGITVVHEIPPFRVQSKTMLAQVYTALGLMLGMLAFIYLLVPDPAPASILFGAFVAVYMGLGETLVKDIRDVDNDAKGGKKTTAVKYGVAPATRAAFCAYTLALIAWSSYAWFGELPTLVAALGAVALLAWAAWVLTAERILRTRFVKAVCIWLHKGSVLVFVAANAAVLVGWLA